MDKNIIDWKIYRNEFNIISKNWVGKILNNNITSSILYILKKSV